MTGASRGIGRATAPAPAPPGEGGWGVAYFGRVIWTPKLVRDLGLTG